MEIYYVQEAVETIEEVTKIYCCISQKNPTRKSQKYILNNSEAKKEVCYVFRKINKERKTCSNYNKSENIQR